MSYDVLDDGGSTLAVGLSGTSTTVSVPATPVTPRVRLRYANWLSSSATIAASACTGWPEAPVLTLAPGDGQITATWPALADNGSAVTSYTATTTPAGGTCTVAVPAARSCTFTGLTDGTSYSVAVTATSAAGTGPPGTASAVPYPAAVMSAARLRLWLDGADAATFFTDAGCTTTGSDAGSTVGCWKDKSGQLGHVTQSTAAARPVLTVVNGHPVPSFDGSSHYLSGNASLLPSGASTGTTVLVGPRLRPAGGREPSPRS